MVVVIYRRIYECHVQTVASYLSTEIWGTIPQDGNEWFGDPIDLVKVKKAVAESLYKPC